ncbi:MAG: PQQ-dependent sugar dehydrogenase [Planctomycetota bacterium]
MLRAATEVLRTSAIVFVRWVVPTITLGAILITPAAAITLPDGFVDEQVLTDLDSPNGFRFAPDGRLFWAERINGRLRTATYDTPTDTWMVEPTIYYDFDTPVDTNGTPERHRSSGLRDFAFDPDFAVNGYIYAVYMKHDPRHNRVVRITQDPADPTRALSASETLLLDMPFNATGSSGSHNGAAIEIGPDNRLYITTGDGWNGGDGVQSLTTYTGKLFRINLDGSIPSDNPFADEAAGPLRATYALGLRNPYTMTNDTEGARLFVNDAIGSRKDELLLVEPGANWGHQGDSGIGTDRGVWMHSTIESSSAADKLITGGAWYPTDDGPFPLDYHGRLFVCNWGSNSSSTGIINILGPEPSDGGERFASDVAKPVMVRVGPDGHLYYMYTTYQTFNARIHRIRYTGQLSAATPRIEPFAGQYVGGITVTITTTTPNAEIRYTLDSTGPTASSALYTAPLFIDAPITLRARTFATDLAPSGTAESFFNICADPSCNAPPTAVAGTDITAEIGQQVVLSGSASSDPDTDEALLSDGWRQVSGPPVEVLNDDETTAYFTPAELGWYRFEYFIEDELSRDTDTLDVFVTPCIQALPSDQFGEWRFDEGAGDIANDTASGFLHMSLDEATWAPSRSGAAGFALEFDGQDDAADLPSLDIVAQGLTIAAWVNADDFGQHDARILSKSTGVNENDHYWMLSTIGTPGAHAIRLRLKTDIGGTDTLVATEPLPAGQWVHIAATYDGATMRLYQDGTEVGARSKAGAIATDPNVPVAVGNQPQRDRPFDGRIDELRLFRRALDPAEIAALADPTPSFDLDASGAIDGADLAAFDANPVDLDADAVIDEADRACLAAYITRTDARDRFKPCHPFDIAPPFATADAFDIALTLAAMPSGGGDVDGNAQVNASDVETMVIAQVSCH